MKQTVLVLDETILLAQAQEEKRHFHFDGLAPNETAIVRTISINPYYAEFRVRKSEKGFEVTNLSNGILHMKEAPKVTSYGTHTRLVLPGFVTAAIVEIQVVKEVSATCKTQL